MDTYRNLTIKSLFLLKLASMPSFHFDFVLKTDDDVYINLKASSRLVVFIIILLYRYFSLQTLSQEVKKHQYFFFSPKLLLGHLESMT